MAHVLEKHLAISKLYEILLLLIYFNNLSENSRNGYHLSIAPDRLTLQNVILIVLNTQSKRTKTKKDNCNDKDDDLF